MSLSIAAADFRLSRPRLAPWGVAALIVVSTLALHIPARGLRGGDDPFFIEVARLWLQGAPPYLNAFDVKPPGYFFLLALAELVFGPTQAAVNGLTIFCEAGTALCLWALGRRLGSGQAGLFAALGYPLLSQMLADNPGYPPLALATTAAFLIAASDFRGRALAAGLAIGMAATIKQSACLEALPLLWWLLRQDPRLRTALAFLAATAAAPLAFAALFALQGAFAPFFADVVLTALRRPGLEPETTSQILAHFVSVQKKVLLLVAVALIGVARLATLTPKAPAAALALALWLAASWVELALQHARWLLYIGPSLAPLLLLAGLTVAAAIRSPVLRPVAMGVLLLATALHVWPFRYWQLLGPEDAALYSAAAQAVEAQNPVPGDRLFGLGVLEAAEVNTQTGVKPPTSYFYWLHLACDFPGAGPQKLFEAFAAAPRFVVAASRPYHPYCEDPAVWPFVAAELARDYRRIAEISGEANGLIVYERKAPPG